MQNLSLTDRHLDALNAVKKEIIAKYPSVNIETIQMDVSNTDAVEEGILATVNKFGRIDVAVNVAGVSQWMRNEKWGQN
jgi:short-subunit dehydrogenase